MDKSMSVSFDLSKINGFIWINIMKHLYETAIFMVITWYNPLDFAEKNYGISWKISPTL